MNNSNILDSLHDLRHYLKSGKVKEAQAMLHKLIMKGEMAGNDASKASHSSEETQVNAWLSPFLDTEHRLLLSHLNTATDEDTKQLDTHVTERHVILESGLRSEEVGHEIVDMCDLLGYGCEEKGLPAMTAFLHSSLRHHLLADEAMRMEVNDLSQTMASSLGKMEQIFSESGSDTSDLGEARKILGETLPSDPRKAMLCLHKACDYLISADSKLHVATETMTQQIKENLQEVNQLRGRLKQAQVEARRDVLTGLPNRRMLQEYFEQMDEKKPVCFVMLDLDHFKDVNDTHGHDVGDEVLTAMAGRILSSLRAGDLLARVGGEEFAAVLPGVSGKRAFKIADAMRQALAAEPIATSAGDLPITVSAGVAIRRWQEDVEGWMKRADKALYEAKNEGRNRTKVAIL